VARLPLYQRALAELQDRGVPTVSSAHLADLTGVTSARVRKDLSHLGSYGVRGVGYDVAFLQYQICRGLGLTQDWRVVIVGAGNMGRALASYADLAPRGFRIVGVLDSDPAVVGTKVGPQRLRVQGSAHLEDVVAALRPDIAVIATPAGVAQQVCDRLVACGIGGILNFAPAVLAAPAGVEIRKVDLGLELQVLAFHEQQRRSGMRAAAKAANGAVEVPTRDWEQVR
jgi:redox-sensing transcriptional repressor